MIPQGKSELVLKIKKNWKSNIIQILILIAVLYFVQKWQTRNLLPSLASAPGFQLTSLEGTQYTLDQYRGKKVLLYFFAPWCSVCKVSSINVNRFYTDIGTKQNPVILAIGLSYRNPRELKEFAENHNLKMPVLVGNQIIGDQYNISGFPVFYFIDENGKIKSNTIGFTTKTGLLLRSGWQ